MNPRLLLCIVLAGLLVVAVYWPGLAGGFMFDDYAVIVTNPALVIGELTPGALLDAAFSTATGPLRRPLAMLSFAADRTLGGLDPRLFKTVNLALHLVNAVLVFVLVRRLMPWLASTGGSAHGAIAACVALAWAVHPVNLSAVLYIVQRMTLLAALFTLVALLAYVALRTAQIAGRPRPRPALPLLVLGFFAGLLCKETAALLPAFVLVLELAAFRFRGLPRLQGLRFVAAAAVAVAALVAASVVLDELMARYASREFTLTERLLTEARVMSLYLRMILLPEPTQFALFHDDVAFSSGLFEPATTFPALAVVGLLVALAARGRPPWLAFGAGWFLAGHLLESTILPLELMHEHRNYLAALGPLLAVAVAVDAAVRRRAGVRAVAFTALLIIAVLALLSHQRARAWVDDLLQMAIEVRHHPASSRTQYEYGRLAIRRGQESGDHDLFRDGVRAVGRAVELPQTPKPFLAPSAVLKLALEADDAAARERILARIRNDPRDKVLVEVFHELVVCQGFGDCRPQPGPVLELARSALDDPDLSRWHRRRVREWLAVYYLRVLADAEAGIGLLRDLVAERPSSSRLRLRLAEALAANGRREEGIALAREVSAALPWHVVVSDRPFLRRVRTLLDSGGEVSPQYWH